MEGHLEPGNAASAGDRGRPFPDLQAAFHTALAAPDVRRAQDVIAEAADGGADPGRLYVDVVRPALAAIRDTDPVRWRLGIGVVQAIVTDLVRRVPLTGVDTAARVALLTSRSDGIERIDAMIAIDFLEADGWIVEHVAGREEPPDGSLAPGAAVELAVAVTAGPQDTLELVPMFTALRRLPDPPVILLCDFSERQEHHAAIASLGADALARHPSDLVAQASRRLPGPGERRWGVSLRRQGDALVLAPTGRLDAISVSRLAEVALSRLGTFSSLILDLRDVAQIEAGGMLDLGRPPWLELAPAVWGDARTLDRVAGIDHEITLLVVGAAS